MTLPWEKPPRCADCPARYLNGGCSQCDGFCDPPDYIDDAQPELGRVAADPLGIPVFLRRDANNRAPFMDVVATKPQPQACTEPSSMPWSADFNKPTE